MAAANLKVFQIRFILLLKEHLPMAQPLNAVPTVKYPFLPNHGSSYTINSNLIIAVRKKNPLIAKKLQKIEASVFLVKTKLPEDKNRLIDLVNTHLTLCDGVVKLADELEICKEYKENKAYKDIKQKYIDLDAYLKFSLEELQNTIDKRRFCCIKYMELRGTIINKNIADANKNLAALRATFPLLNAPQPPSADLKIPNVDDIKDDEAADEKKSRLINSGVNVDKALYKKLKKANLRAAKAVNELHCEIGMKFNSAHSLADVPLRRNVVSVINLCLRNAFLLSLQPPHGKEQFKRATAYVEILNGLRQFICCTDIQDFKIPSGKNEFSQLLAQASQGLNTNIKQLEKCMKAVQSVPDHNSFTHGIRDSFYRRVEELRARVKEKVDSLDKPDKLKAAITASIEAILQPYLDDEKNLLRIEAAVEKYAFKKNLSNSEYRYLCRNIADCRHILFSQFVLLFQRIDQVNFNRYKYHENKQIAYIYSDEPDRNPFICGRLIASTRKRIEKFLEIDMEERFSVSPDDQTLLPVNLSDYTLDKTYFIKEVSNLQTTLLNIVDEIIGRNNKKIISLYEGTHNKNLDNNTTIQIANLIRVDAKKQYLMYEAVLNNIKLCSKYCRSIGVLARIDDLIAELNIKFEKIDDDHNYDRDHYINIYMNGNSIVRRHEKIEEAGKILKRSEQLLADLQSASAI
jgi:hypothetical protein